MHKFSKYATDLLLFLKYNHDLQDSDKLIGIQCRLSAMYNELKEEELPVSDYTNIIPQELIPYKILN